MEKEKGGREDGEKREGERTNREGERGNREEGSLERRPQTPETESSRGNSFLREHRNGLRVKRRSLHALGVGLNYEHCRRSQSPSSESIFSNVPIGTWRKTSEVEDGEKNTPITVGLVDPSVS